MKTLLSLAVLTVLVRPAFAQTVPPDREGLLKGEGMGLAVIAERNGFPGPKHVLEMKEELGLTRDQENKARALMDGVQASARVIGQDIVDREEILNKLFETGSVDEQRLQSALREIGKLRADLRFVHLQAHLRMKEILTADQRAQYYSARTHEASK